MTMSIEFEWHDGLMAKYTAETHQDAWDLVALVDPVGNEIKSAWRDDEPWFGVCTDLGAP